MQRTDNEMLVSKPEAQGTSNKQREFKRRKMRVLTASSRHDKETIPMNSEQYGCPNETFTMTTSVDMTTRMGKSNKAPPSMKSYRPSMATES